MKKVITIVMIICIMICGCNKEEKKEIETETETKVEDEVKTVNMKCELCRKLTDCKEFEYNKKYYYLCDECYDEVGASIAGCENFDAIVYACYVASTSENAIKEVLDMGDGYITIDEYGIKLENIGKETKKALLSCIPELMDLKSFSRGKIKIYADSSNGMWVSKEEIPINLIDSIQ